MEQSGEPKNNTLAIVGFILSFIIPIVGLILCIIALVQIKKTGEKGKGLAVAGIILFGVLALIVIIAIIVSFVVLNPGAQAPLPHGP